MEGQYMHDNEKKGRIRRRFVPGAWEHVYKRRKDGFLVFYSIRDRLVYYTIFSVVATKRRMHVIGLCIMPDHVHELIEPGSRTEMSAFEQEVNSRFSREWNLSAGSSGAVFETYGSAPKQGEKHQRTAFAYLVNNPPERKLCRRAELTRWNFLAYACSAHPFSEAIRKKHISRALQRSLDRVTALHAAGRPLGYSVLDSLTDGLDSKEVRQLTDHIISVYNVIDYNASIRLYGNYGTLLVAVNANTGSEYEIDESFTGYSDKVYSQMTDIVTGRAGDIKDVISWGADKKKELYQLLRRSTDATSGQILKFLHMRDVGLFHW